MGLSVVGSFRVMLSSLEWLNERGCGIVRVCARGVEGLSVVDTVWDVWGESGWE